MKKADDFYPVKGRVILHIDMNAFYCSVHEAVAPELYAGKPCAVCGSIERRKGIIVTSSYAARKRGVRTAMQVREALKLCPELILIQPDFHLYRSYSRQFMRLVGEYTPQIQAMSIDECYADISGSRQFGTPLEIAGTIQQRIRDELGLPCSIGIAPNKLLAKMASDMRKPNGITVLRLRDVPAVLWPLSCSSMYGIGEKTATKLARLGITTIGQLAVADERRMTDHFGTMGAAMIRAANGRDESEVRPDSEPSKSIGHTTTLPANIHEPDEVKHVFLNIADQVCRRLRKQQLLASTVQITIRDPDMRTVTRSMTLGTPTEEMQVVYQSACTLFEKRWTGGKPIRLLGITLQGLEDKKNAAQQLDLFDFESQPKREQLNMAMDKLRDKFGEDAVLTAGMLSDDPSALIRDHKRRGTSLQVDFLKKSLASPSEDEDS